MKCPVCKTETTELLCPNCGFDMSRDIFAYPSLVNLKKGDVDSLKECMAAAKAKLDADKLKTAQEEEAKRKAEEEKHQIIPEHQEKQEDMKWKEVIPLPITYKQACEGCILEMYIHSVPRSITIEPYPNEEILLPVMDGDGKEILKNSEQQEVYLKVQLQKAGDTVENLRGSVGLFVAFIFLIGLFAGGKLGIRWTGKPWLGIAGGAFAVLMIYSFFVNPLLKKWEKEGLRNSSQQQYMFNVVIMGILCVIGTIGGGIIVGDDRGLAGGLICAVIVGLLLIVPSMHKMNAENQKYEALYKERMAEEEKL